MCKSQSGKKGGGGGGMTFVGYLHFEVQVFQQVGKKNQLWLTCRGQQKMKTQNRKFPRDLNEGLEVW